MTTVTMTPALLELISCVQAFRLLAVREATFFESVGKPNPDPKPWMDRAWDYFVRLTAFDSLGLRRNRFCFEAMLAFQITGEMTAAEPDELSGFAFTY